MPRWETHGVQENDTSSNRFASPADGGGNGVKSNG